MRMECGQNKHIRSRTKTPECRVINNINKHRNIKTRILPERSWREQEILLKKATSGLAQQWRERHTQAIHLTDLQPNIYENMGPSDKRIQATDRGRWCLAQRACFHQPDGYSWQDQSNMARQGWRVGRWKQSCLEQPAHLRVQQCLLSTTHHPHLYQET